MSETIRAFASSLRQPVRYTKNTKTKHRDINRNYPDQREGLLILLFSLLNHQARKAVNRYKLRLILNYLVYQDVLCIGSYIGSAF